MTGLLVQWSLAAAIPTEYFYLADYNTTTTFYSLNKSFSFYFGIQAAGSIFFDFSAAPIEFDNKMAWGVGIFPSLAAGDHVNYCVLGFEEQL